MTMLENYSLEDAISQFRERNIDEKLRMLENKKVYLYGAGSFGTEMSELLLQKGIKVEAFLDINASEIGYRNGLKVYHPQDQNLDKGDNTVVVFAILMDKDIRRDVFDFIRSFGFKEIVEALSLRCFMVDFREKMTFKATAEYVNLHKDRILAAAELWEDEKSRALYINSLYAHFTGDYSRCFLLEDNLDKAYFPDDVNLEKGYGTFIDCGGFTGDTVAKLGRRADVNCIVSFEPNKENFTKLSKTCEEIDKAIYLYPCAVSNEMDFKRFSGHGGSGKVAAEGEELVQTVELDRVLINIKPTFIKMDIEGSELSALWGAKKILRRDEPDLAICVYHYISDFWEIPILIKKLNRNYGLYLRSYNVCTLETVLYAVVR